MTTKQFLKEFVSNGRRLEAEEILDQMLMDSQEKGFVEARNQACWTVRGLANEIKSW